MDGKKEAKSADPKDQPSDVTANADSGEYGVEQILAPNQEKMEEARKHSFYHFSKSELEHKSDPIDQIEDSSK